MTRDEVSMAEVNGRVKPLLANFIGKSDTLWVNKLSGTVKKTTGSCWEATACSRN